VYDLIWTQSANGKVTYGDVFHQNEVEMSNYNFEKANTDILFQHFTDYVQEASALLAAELVLPAYDMVLKASHTFNLLDARHAISVTERQNYILQIRTLACNVAKAYYAAREAKGFPLVRALQERI